MTEMSLIWLGIIAFCIVVEFVTPSALISIWFVFGGLVALLLSLFNVPLIIQIVVFLVISMASIMILRPISNKYIKVNSIATNADRVIGEEGLVIKTISKDEWGQVKVQGSVWSAICVDDSEILKDERVKIVSIDGAKLIVKRK